ncbi:hypothetical protein QWY99_08515 [Flavobacterium branchiarum]|uniref:hypothetical protein n=1 Tax=Flavobacterium branchiarum TaxID=1114870 RepID=UPI0025B414BA|nr:hypothetical protein [Flavobacterium branchiarum]MDN3673089.1 hypothetical protein [Flavobacterium branchiarum]
MTPRKELFIKTKEALSELLILELVDLQRKQFSMPKENYPSYFTAALIEIKAITWQTMVEQKQEGKATVDVTFYCKDGWMDQHNGTADPEHGLIEVDVIDNIVEQLQGLRGDSFKQLDLTNEESVDDAFEMMSYKLSFSTVIYRRINPRFSSRKISIQPTTL